jgi:inhibitor of KinA
LEQIHGGSPVFRIRPLSDRSVLLSFGNVVDPAINDRVLALHDALTSEGFPGFIESVPAYASLAVFYDPCRVLRKAGERILEAITNLLLQKLAGRMDTQRPNAGMITIPVCYDPEFGPDINEVATRQRLSIDELVSLHVSVVYRVYMIGFSPGFPYMGNLDPRIATPRREQPRIRLPAGSVGIAGSQTGIYPQDSPGGWQLIGRTPLKLFDPAKASPCLLKAGDRVKFLPIDKTEFTRINADYI